MSKGWRKQNRASRPPVGAAPGTLVANPTAEPTVINLAMIAPGKAEFRDAVPLSEVDKALASWPLVWVDCVGLADLALIERLGKRFDLHPLALEDAVNVGERPKADFFDASVFVNLFMVDDAASHRVEQISVFFGERFVVTFQERAGDPFESVRRRIRGHSPLCTRKGDYLAYALIDAVVDSFFPLIDALGDKIDLYEDKVFAGERDRRIRELHTLRRGAVGMKRKLGPLRDALAALARAETPLVTAETKTYLNDTLDHAVRMLETLENDRDMLSGLIEIDISLAQERANEVVSFLTVVSAIFIPLTFFAGIWGMNFDPDASPWNMPELRAWFGYPAALLFMAAMAVAMVIYFKRKKWL